MVDLSNDERDRLGRLVKARRGTPKPHRQITLARARTESVDVVVPSLEGKTEKTVTETTERVIDLLIQMYNRKDITQVQFAAGDRYRTAFEMLSMSSGGAGDFDRVRGGGSGGMALGLLAAADDVLDAKLKVLYPRDYAVMHRVCVLGKTFDRVAQELTGMDLGLKFDRQTVGYMFKSALSQLAAHWWPNKVPRIDQATMDYLAGGPAGDKAQFVIEGSPEWARLQQYRKNKGQPLLVAKAHKIGNEERKGAWLRVEMGKLTSVVYEKPIATDSEAVDAPAVVAHSTRDKIFYSNKEERKK